MKTLLGLGLPLVYRDRSGYGRFVEGVMLVTPPSLIRAQCLVTMGRSLSEQKPLQSRSRKWAGRVDATDHKARRWDAMSPTALGSARRWLSNRYGTSLSVTTVGVIAGTVFATGALFNGTAVEWRS